jgi:hypothetical protein
MAAVFSQSDIDIMCKAIDIADGHLAKRGYCNCSREVIASRIVACAAAGERDPARLAQAALTEPIEPEATAH